MNSALQKIKRDIQSEYETFAVRKVEVKNLAEEIKLIEEKHAKEVKRLEAKVLMAYSFGYEDHYKGLKFDTEFKIDDIELGDSHGKSS